MTAVQNGKVLTFPNEGALLVASDLHGNYPDFDRMRSLFIDAQISTGDAYLLFLGDLVHGPSYSEEEWPDFMGTFYEDRAPEVFGDFLKLREQYPGRVFSLLGNHEHAHVGGPNTGKYSRPGFEHDERGWFEHAVGSRRMNGFLSAMREFPIVALTPAGVVFTHGAPYLERPTSLDELANLSYEGYRKSKRGEMHKVNPLGRILWPYCAPPDVVQSFLSDIASNGQNYGIVVHGHDAVMSGADIVPPNRVNLSTSFKMEDQNKTFMRIDLEGKYPSVDHLREGSELLRLYPEEQ